MAHPIRHPFVLLLFLTLACGALQAQHRGEEERIDFTVAVDTAAETFLVTAELHNIPQDSITWNFPIWGPGAYDIVTFGGWVDSLTATSSTGRLLPVRRLDSSSYRLPAGDRVITLSYRVRDIENLGSSPWFGLSDVEGSYAFANTVALFGYPEGKKEIPYTVTWRKPNGWDLAISLDTLRRDLPSFRARDYDELVDAPVVMGRFQTATFTVGGKPHGIIVVAPEQLPDSEMTALAGSAQAIVEKISDFFGELPYDRYLFQYFLVNPGPGDFAFGALEHRNSSTYRMPYIIRPGASIASMMAPVVAHEYWHAWIPKRIHVAELGPFDYQRPPRTSSLWFAEGMTEYYARVLLARHGLDSGSELFRMVDGVMRTTYDRPQPESLAELSRRVSEAELGEFVAVYSKGPVVALLLDAEIRRQTGYTKSLDDAVLYFNEHYGKSGRTFGDDEIIPIMEQGTGARLQSFYDRFIVGREPLPYDELLPVFGLRADTTIRSAEVLAATLEKAPEGYRIADVRPGGSADSSGLRVGDVVTKATLGSDTIAITDFPPQFFDFPLSRRMKTLFVLRDGREMAVQLVRVPSSVVTVRLVVDPNALPQQVEARRSILGSAS